MRSRSLFLVLSLAVLTACGGGKSSSTSSTTNGVSVTPATASVATNSTQQLTATVSNSNSGVYWSVNGTVGGNLTVGTISTSGLYTAPAVVPNPADVTITATSITDSTQTGTAKLTITSGTALSLTITPTSASVFTGRTLQFATTFNTTANNAVTWQVNQITGGDTTHGTISSNGLYTAPTAVPSPAAVTVTAISQADTTKTASATVTIVLGTSIVVGPAFVTIPAGGTQAFTATANNNPVSVTWSVSCNQPGACGSISSAGVYTAPAFPPQGGVVAITATSTDQSALPAGANATIQVSNGSLVGQYAFSFAGKNSGGAYASAGTITFDGAGGITTGSEDVNNGSATGVSITGGTYHIGTDGRGLATVVTSAGTETWQIALKDNTKAFLIRGDANVSGSGTMYSQDSTKFNVAAITGNYGLQANGPAAGQTGATAIAGAVAANGAGAFTSGKVDISTGTTASPNQAATGTYVAPSSTTGRGTLSISDTSGTQNFAYYVVNGTRLVIVETDAGATLRGELLQQAGGTISAASFAGSYAMVVSGTNNSGAPFGMGSVFTLDGAGNVTNGTADVNSNGVTQAGVALSGTYSVTDSATGRTEASVTVNNQARKFVVYPASSGSAFVLEIDGVQTTSGRAFLQSSNPLVVAQFTGTYATSLTGTDFVNSPGEEDVTGNFVPNGGSALSGTVDINDSGTIARNATVQGSYLVSSVTSRASGTLNTSSNTLSSGTFVYYVVDANRSLVLELDSNRSLVGTMEKPY